MRLAMPCGTVLCLLVLGMLLPGCAGYGTVRFQGWDAGDRKVQEMLASFSGYHIYYSGMTTAYPSGLIFDPKDDGNRVEPGKWSGVESQGLAELLVRNLRRYQHFKPKLYALIGDDGREYGFIYTGYREIVVEQVAERAVTVRDMPQPPHLKYDQNGGTFSPGLR